MTDTIAPGQISYSPDYKTAAREVVDGIFGLGPFMAPPPPLVKPAQSDPRDAEIARLRAIAQAAQGLLSAGVWVGHPAHGFRCAARHADKLRDTCVAAGFIPDGKDVPYE